MAPAAREHFRLFANPCDLVDFKSLFKAVLKCLPRCCGITCRVKIFLNFLLHTLQGGV